MDFQSFLAALLKTVNAGLPDGRQAEYRTVNKPNNVTYTGMHLKNDGTESGSPLVYMEPLFEEAGGSPDFTGLAKRLIRILLQPVPYFGDCLPFGEQGFPADRIVFRLLRIRDNEDYLKNIPHRTFLDLAVTYGVLVAPGSPHCGLAMITQEIMNSWGIDEDTLHRCALENSGRLMGVRRIPLSEYISKAPGSDQIPLEDPEEEKLFMVTNQLGFLGAAVLVYSDEIRRIAEELEEDLFFVLPVTHEILTVPASSRRAGNLPALVRSFFQEGFRPEELLSPSVYRYNRKQDQFVIAFSGEGNAGAANPVV